MHTNNPHSVYLFLRSNYLKQMLVDGWYIDYRLHGFNAEKQYYIIPNPIEFNFEDAINKAKLHGILMNENRQVIGIDMKQFEKTLYLWQVQELGIL